MMTPNPLDSINYPQIDETISREFGNPISALEIQVAIKSMQNGRSPGPDGFTVEFYKAFSASLVLILVRGFQRFLLSRSTASNAVCCLHLFAFEEG